MPPASLPRKATALLLLPFWLLTVGVVHAVRHPRKVALDIAAPVLASALLYGAAVVIGRASVM